MNRRPPAFLWYCCASILPLFTLAACASVKPTAPIEAPRTISDRGVQEHGKVWPRSIDSAYMGTWGDNRNSGTTLVTSFERRKLAGQSEYLSWTQPNSPPVSALMTTPVCLQTRVFSSRRWKNSP